MRAHVQGRDSSSPSYADTAAMRSGARPRFGRAPRGSDADQANESPHAHELCALGLSIVKPCFSIVSEKSIVAPIR